MTHLDSLLWRERSTLERHDSRDGTEVTYEFPNGFQIKVTRKGILFAGNSVTYDVGSIMLVEKAIGWAKIIALPLRNGGGLAPQAECEGRLVMVARDGKAWWKGQFKNAIRDTDGVKAEAILRKQIRDNEIREHAEHDN